MAASHSWAPPRSACRLLRVGRSSTRPGNEQYHLTCSNIAFGEYCVPAVNTESVGALLVAATCADLGCSSDRNIKSVDANTCFSPPVHQEDTGMGSTV